MQPGNLSDTLNQLAAAIESGQSLQDIPQMGSLSAALANVAQALTTAIQNAPAGTGGGGTGVTPNITATASVDDSGGTPAVTVTKSGTQAAPSFRFAFTGLRGADGVPGAPGKDGAPGRDGRDGADGQPGAPGRDGVDGAPGRDGVDGKDGVDGAPGKDGAGSPLNYSTDEQVVGTWIDGRPLYQRVVLFDALTAAKDWVASSVCDDGDFGWLENVFFENNNVSLCPVDELVNITVTGRTANATNTALSSWTAYAFFQPQGVSGGLEAYAVIYPGGSIRWKRAWAICRYTRKKDLP